MLCAVVFAVTATAQARRGPADIEARVEADMARIESLVARGRIRSALVTIEALEHIAPGRVAVLALHRRILIAHQGTPRQIGGLLAACETSLGRESALECALAFALGGRFEAAIALATRDAARYDPAASAVLAEIGARARASGAHVIAASCAERAYLLAPDDPARTIVAAQYRIDAGLPASASALLEPLLVAQPGNLDARVVAAEAAMLAGDHDRAIAHYTVRRLHCPANEAVHCLTDLATAQLYGGRLDAAVATSSLAASRACPEDARPHRVLGLALVRLGREDEARNAFDESLRRREDATTRALRRALDPR